jgi:hypothetical protein
MKDVTRATFVLLLLATAAEGSEICRFRAEDADDPFRRWLSSQEVTCVAAGTPLEFPKGLWNVFARAEGSVSVAPLLIDGNAAPASIAPALVPGAILTPLLPQGHGGVIYVPRRGSAIPVDGARMTVPADEPLWLFVLDRTTPVAVIPIAALAPGTNRQVDARSGGAAAIVGWLQVPEPDRTAIAAASAVLAPVIRAGTRDADVLPPPSLLHGAFFVIRDVAPGNTELRLEGRGWIPNRRVVQARPGLTVAAAPLTVRATGTLVVNWNTDEDLPTLERSIGSCTENETPPKIIITVSKCPALRGPRGEVAECTQVREETVDGFLGSMAFDDIVPGLYRAEMRYGKLPPSGGMASVGPLRVADLRVFASYFTVYGSVTRGGQPLGEDVRITFPGGIGFAPEESEEYRAVFNSHVAADTQVDVAACDGAPRAIVLTDKPIRPRARFDLDIPANELTVRVTDTFTRDVLPGATVKLDAMSIRHGEVVFTSTKAADEQGNVAWSGVPVRELHLTVTHAGYEKRFIEPFTMDPRGAKSIDAQLVPLRGTHGKIVSDRPFAAAEVIWFSAAGSQTERVDLAPEGTFVYANRHTPDETMAVVSESHPLWVLRSPPTEERQSITLAFPNAAAVAFEVWLAAAVPPAVTRYVGVVIGGVRVPQPVLAEHQALRRDPPLLRGAGPLPIRDLLATGPVDVLLGPTAEEVAVRARSMDLFVLPQFADPPRQRLQPGTTDVVFTIGNGRP